MLPVPLVLIHVAPITVILNLVSLSLTYFVIRIVIILFCRTEKKQRIAFGAAASATASENGMKKFVVRDHGFLQ